MLPSIRQFLLIPALLAAAHRAAAADVPADGEKFRPVLEPHFAAGQFFGYNAHATYGSLIRVTQHSTEFDKDGNEQKVDKYPANVQTQFQVEFVADTALAREVFKNGSLREAVFKVTRCQAIDEKYGLKPLIAPGSILGARKQPDGQIAFAINGIAPDPQLAAELSVLIVLGNNQVTNDDLFGPPAPVAKNAVWPINLSAVLKSDLPQCFPGLSSVIGDVGLVSVRADQSAGPRAVISADYSLAGVKFPLNLPNLKAEPSTVHFTIVATTPVAGGPGAYDLQLTSLVRHAAHSGNAKIGMAGSDAEFNIDVDQSVHFLIDATHRPDPELARAPAEPPAPPIPPGLSAANIFRTPTSWVKTDAPTNKSGATPPATMPANSTPPKPAPQPAPPNPTSSIPLNPQVKSPFDSARDLPTQPSSASSSK